MKTRRRKAKAKQQIPDAPQQSENQRVLADHRVRWSDFDGPPSKFVKRDSERVGDFTEGGLEDFGAVFGLRRSVVSITSETVDGEQIMCCSGTVVDHVDNETWIITSAILVRKHDTQFAAYERDDIKIEVVLHNGQIVEGSLETCNLHYNIAIVSIKSSLSLIYLPAVQLRDLPTFYSLHPRPVVVLGRHIISKEFLMRCGNLVRTKCELDCNELLVCMCDISKDFIGGPVMDSEKRFLGITYYFEESAPFLPVDIAVRFLKYTKIERFAPPTLKKKRTLPCLRLRVQALHMLRLDVLERICCKFAMPPSGVLVDKICDISTEKYGGIEAGDIISALDGATLHSIEQFTTTFLDKLEVAMDTQNTLIVQAFVQRPTDMTSFIAMLNVREVVSDECEKSFQNRWMHWRNYGFDEQL